MADETDTTSEVARTLREHFDPTGTERHDPYVAAVYEEAAAALAGAGLLRPQIATQEPAGATQGGSGGSRHPGGLAERLRSAADYQDRPGAYDELRAMADEVDRLEVVSNGARIKVQLDRVVALADEWDRAAERRSDLYSDLFDPTAADAYRSRAADLRDVLAQEVP